ncbi:MAG: NADH-quinone oxidoreductase subunit L [Phycisphaerales bacterium]
MTGVLNTITGTLAAQPVVDGPGWFALIPLLPLLASVACGIYLAGKVKSKIPAWTVVGALAIAFLLTLVGFLNWDSSSAQLSQIYEWMSFSGAGDSADFTASFGFYMDGLSWLWMLFVTGLGTLIALYASEYMQGDKGYARFFAAFALFVFSMSCLVMGDNLVLLYLGWEGVGLCSYLLIGYFYTKPEAVAAAKKAFIVNRIGDLGLALGLFLTFVTFGSIQYDEIFAQIGNGVTNDGQVLADLWQTWAIPLLLMVGAFGKSAQLPLYVWLPDAMEGPTPVSALIHAATMVTAGVYLIARFFPLFAFEGVPHYALDTVAWVGALTALLAATIGMAQFDIKRIMAYSTVSQLGYMFAGLGVLSTVGAASHVFTHAFFKALLFLACGAVMHGFAGQLDLRKLSGLGKMKGWGIVSITMLVGCLNLAGFPLITAGYWSKDMIMAEAFVTPVAGIGASNQDIGWILVLTAGLTAYYTFRVYFRVFMGPVEYHPGDEHHGDDEDHGHDDHTHSDNHGHSDGHSGGFHPHAPGWAINSVLVILAICSFLAIGLYFSDKENHGWVGNMVHDSSAHYVSPYAHHEGDDHAIAPITSGAEIVSTATDPHAADHSGDHAGGGTLFGQDPHFIMYWVSAFVGLFGILVAYVLHLHGRTKAETAMADKLLPYLGPIPKWAQNKWYVDEFYDFAVRLPLKGLATLFYFIDALLVDGFVNLCGKLPRLAANALRPSQSGVLQNYATGMAAGLAVLAIILWIVIL